MKKLITLCICLSLLVTSCKDGENQNFLPTSVGAINAMVVVIDNDLWKGQVGDSIRRHFAAPVLGMPMDEPLFSIDQIAPKFFTGAIRNTRSVLYVMKDSVNVAHVKHNMYAAPQNVGVIKGTTEAEIMQNLASESDKIITAFKNMEIIAAQKRFNRSLNKENVLQEKFGISLQVPSIYKVGKQEAGFVWIDREIQKGTANIIVYELPAERFNNDTTLVRDIIAMRDSIGEQFIPGPDVVGKTTHMRTEPAYAPAIFPVEISGMKGVEVRGIWDMKNYPMAGPFLTYILNDKANNRKLVLEGFVFAPATQKRDDMFELEAILKTLKFSSGSEM